MNEHRSMPTARDFRPDLTKFETIVGWVYLPIHIFLLPILLGMLQSLWPSGEISDISVNLMYYGIGLLVVAVFFGKLLRREFDHFCDAPFRCLFTLFAGYAVYWAAMYAVQLVVLLLGLEPENPNDANIGTMLGQNFNRMLAVSVVGAPFIEETLFRGVVFQSIRKKNRALAYLVSVALFSVYHVWQYAVADMDAAVLLYALQYIPITLVITWIYERSGSLWTCMLFHGSYNYLSMHVMQQLMN